MWKVMGALARKTKSIEARSCNFRGRRVIELHVLARALDEANRIVPSVPVAADQFLM